VRRKIKLRPKFWSLFYSVLKKSRLAPILRRSRILKKFKGKLDGSAQTNGNLPQQVEQSLLVLGNPVISKTEWNRRKSLESQKRSQQLPSYNRMFLTPKSSSEFETQRIIEPEISVIISIYRPGELLDSFLGNIKEQSIFQKSEIVIVLVDPLQEEIDVICGFVKNETNVIFRSVASRITIYDAWNKALSECSAPFVTNMNVDDIRKSSSLETQLKFMKDRPWVDVGYQDFYFLLDRDLDWESIENIGALSDLTPVTLTDLAWFGINPPHNGPIWKRELHARYGTFDASLRSAGDYEFWMRIKSQGAIFAKMSESTVGYFLNPNGMSTSEESPSSKEERALQFEYRTKIETQSPSYPFLSLPLKFKNEPWMGADMLTAVTLDQLKRIMQ
jgi:hypothetical protein